MSITAVVEAEMSDEDFLKQFDSQTKFCVIADLYATPPMGWPYQTELLEKNPIVEQAMVEFPNVTFITHNWHNGLDKLQNVFYYPASFLYFHKLIKHKKESHNYIKKNIELVGVNTIGGSTRINRILASHWLAKNFNLKDLVWAFKGNNDLMPIQNIIKKSPMYNKNHIQTKKFLHENFPSSKNMNIYETFRDYFLPRIYNKSLCSIVLETYPIERCNHISEKSLFAHASGCLLLYVGSYQADQTLQKMGFHTFEKIFDTSHLASRDHYENTVAGLENNKKILDDKEMLTEIFHHNQKEIDHNFNLACNSDHLENIFKSTSKLWKESLKYCRNIDNIKHTTGKQVGYDIDDFFH